MNMKKSNDLKCVRGNNPESLNFSNRHKIGGDIKISVGIFFSDLIFSTPQNLLFIRKELFADFFTALYALFSVVFLIIENLITMKQLLWRFHHESEQLLLQKLGSLLGP